MEEENPHSGISIPNDPMQVEDNVDYNFIVVAMYFIQNKKDATQRPDVITSATRILINEFARTDQCIKLKPT